MFQRGICASDIYQILDSSDGILSSGGNCDCDDDDEMLGCTFYKWPPCHRGHSWSTFFNPKPTSDYGNDDEMVGCRSYKWPPCHRGNEEVFVGAGSERWDWSGAQNIALVHVRLWQAALHNPAITPT